MRHVRRRRGPRLLLQMRVMLIWVRLRLASLLRIPERGILLLWRVSSRGVDHIILLRELLRLSGGRRDWHAILAGSLGRHHRPDMICLTGEGIGMLPVGRTILHSVLLLLLLLLLVLLMWMSLLLLLLLLLECGRIIRKLSLAEMTGIVHLLLTPQEVLIGAIEHSRVCAVLLLRPGAHTA